MKSVSHQWKLLHTTCKAIVLCLPTLLAEGPKIQNLKNILFNLVPIDFENFYFIMEDERKFAGCTEIFCVYPQFLTSLNFEVEN